jgi:hypothetical protein
LRRGGGKSLLSPAAPLPRSMGAAPRPPDPADKGARAQSSERAIERGNRAGRRGEGGDWRPRWWSWRRRERQREGERGALSSLPLSSPSPREDLWRRRPMPRAAVQSRDSPMGGQCIPPDRQLGLSGARSTMVGAGDCLRRKSCGGREGEGDARACLCADFHWGFLTNSGRESGSKGCVCVDAAKRAIECAKVRGPGGVS